MSIVIFSHSRIIKDPRVLRQIAWLTSRANTITTIGLGTRPEGVSNHIEIKEFGLLKRIFGYLIRDNQKRFEYFYQSGLAKLREQDIKSASLLIVNEIEYLNWKLFGDKDIASIPTYLDIHEDHLNRSPRNLAERFAFKKYWEWQMFQLLKFCQTRQKIEISAVENNIANSISRLVEKKVHVIYNAPKYQERSPGQVKENRVKLVHHGMGTAGRGIEEILLTLTRLPKKFTLTLLIFPTFAFKVKIKIMVLFLNLRNRVKVLPGVPLLQLPEILNKFDVAVIWLPDTHKNNINALPNKFFESMQARLAIICGPNESMAKIVREEKIGIAIETWSRNALVGSLRDLEVGDIQQYKSGNDKAAKKYCSEVSQSTFLQIVSKLMS